MATFNPITITNVGEEILAQAVAGDGTLTFTAVSSSSDEESGDLKNITELQNIRQTVAPVIAILEDNTIQLSAVFSNSGLSQGYVVNTLGIYAKIGSEAPILFAVATATDPDTVPAQNPISPSNFYYQFNIAITDDSNITVSVPEEGSLPASVFYQKFGSANISQIGDGTVTGAIIQNANVAGGDKYDSAKSYAAGDYFIYNDQLCKALTAIAAGTELSLDSNYQITSLENEVAGLNGNLEYSTAEQAIGKWIDGRTLYRRVYTGTTPSTPGVSEVIIGLPSSEIIDYAGYIINTAGTHMSIKGYYLSDDEYFVGYPQGSTFRINLSSYEVWFNRPYVLILTYIK